MKTLITDIDSTMCDHWRRIRRNTIPSWPGTGIDIKAWSREEVLKDNILPRCKEVLTELTKEGFTIRYLTARGWPNALPITLDQLHLWGVPNAQDVIVVNNMADKLEVLNRDICDYYVDDFMTGQENNIGTFRHGIARNIQEKGIRVIVFRNVWDDVLEQIELYENRKFGI